ncbi:hypothetical protein RSK60_670015 [Ralstonia solanacearum K60]|nr:hypothetical protein RSK60_670015 [Ralstonia solanacearum K60]
MPQEAAIRLELFGFSHPAIAVSTAIEFLVIWNAVSSWAR